jgi:hypothetical protein
VQPPLDPLRDPHNFTPVATTAPSRVTPATINITVASPSPRRRVPAALARYSRQGQPVVNRPKLYVGGVGIVGPRFVLLDFGFVKSRPSLTRYSGTPPRWWRVNMFKGDLSSHCGGVYHV